MGDPVGIYARDVQGLRRAQRDARGELPADWLPYIEGEARQARPEWGGAVGHPSAQRDVWDRWLGQYGGAQAADLTDRQIKGLATAYALDARLQDIGRVPDGPSMRGGVWAEYARLVEFCRMREVEPPPPLKFRLSDMGARVRCRYWWRKALRRMVAERCESGALALGIVCKSNGQPYASNRAVLRSLQQDESNAKAIERTTLENEEGLRRTLGELVAGSVSNKAIRRGELMTRIRGCEEIADECAHRGLFVTLTCPSRFHSTLRDGRRNPKHGRNDQGRPLSPRDAQAWLCRMWERSRAKLDRLDVGRYGFRVAEPHHDGCTHWHMLVWFPTEDELRAFRRVLRKYWLSDAGDEPGAGRHRVRFKRMLAGGAAGYVAKYISKNIDDHAIRDHLDDYAEGSIQPDLLGDLEIKPSMRVQAWARHWRIHQFQAFGQPPVGVWRELRRVKESGARAAGVGGTIHKAWLAAQRVGDMLADWARYVKAQGGLMLGRAVRVVLRRDTRECDGQYGRAVRSFPVGVALNIACARTVWSERRLWRVIESEGAGEGDSPHLAVRSAAPRTGVNNCTDRDEDDAIRLDFLRGQGGENTKATHEIPDPPGRPGPDHPLPRCDARDSGALRGIHLAEIQRAHG